MLARPFDSVSSVEGSSVEQSADCRDSDVFLVSTIPMVVPVVCLDVLVSWIFRCFPFPFSKYPIASDILILRKIFTRVEFALVREREIQIKIGRNILLSRNLPCLFR